MNEKQPPAGESKAWEWRSADSNEGYRLAIQRQRDLRAKADLSDEERRELEYVDYFLNPEGEDERDE